MKKPLHLSLLVSFLLVSFGQLYAYNITGHNLYDNCTYQYLYVSTNVPVSSKVYKIEISYGDGTSDTNAVDSGKIYAYHTYPQGTYTVNLVLLDSSDNRIDSQKYSQYYAGCTYVQGKLYFDANNDCTYDSGDALLSNSSKIEIDSAGRPIDTIYSTSKYFYRAKTGGVVYSFKLLSYPDGLINSCPSSGVLSATTISATGTSAGDFGFSCPGSSSGYDVAIHPVIHTGRHAFSLVVSLTNSNCNSKNGTITIKVDSRYPVSHNDIDPSSGTTTNNTVTWNYSGLISPSPQTFAISADRGSSWLTPGTLIYDTITVTPTAGDADTTNNTWVHVDTVTASWDPNEKTVSPQGPVSAGSTLTYTLAFENTGNAPAENIHILDTLSGNLDINTMQVITSTHPVTLYNYRSGGLNIVKFEFDGINLPDSSHHGQADGFVMFSIQNRSGLATGTAIDNRAGIYFDDNPVVMTNTVENTIKPTAVPNLKNLEQVTMYPNPVHNDLVIKTDKDNYNSVLILNSMGQTLIQQKVQNNETHVNTSALTPGIYYIMLKGTYGTKVEKVEKL